MPMVFMAFHTTGAIILMKEHKNEMIGNISAHDSGLTLTDKKDLASDVNPLEECHDIIN